MSLFMPAAAASGNVVLSYSANLNWFQRLLPVITNLAAIPAAWYAWRVRLFVICIVFSIAGTVSTYYHACAAWNAACLGLDVSVGRFNDFIWAPFTAVVITLQLLNFYVYPWASMVNYSVLAIVILAQTAAPFTSTVFFAVIVSLGMLLLVRTLVLDGLAEFLVADEAIPMGDNRRRPLAFDRAERYSWPHLVIGAILLMIAFPAFAVDDPSVEWLTHSLLWHLGVFLAGYAILVGVTRNSPRFFESLRALDGGSPRAPRDPPTFYSALSVPAQPPMGELEHAGVVPAREASSLWAAERGEMSRWPSQPLGGSAATGGGRAFSRQRQTDW
jgi:hypothetical protein